jgi:hypothetical protein
VTIPGEVCKMWATTKADHRTATAGAGANVASMSTTTGEPRPRLNNTLRGLDTLPLRIVPA